MEINGALILDLILLAILLLTAFHYSKKGLIAGVLSFGGGIISLLVASVISRKLSPVLFTNLLEENLIKHTEELLVKHQGMISVEEIVHQLAPVLPKDMVQYFLGNTQFDLSVPNITETIVHQVVKPLIIPFISAVLFFVVFTLCKILISLLVAALKNINRIPLLGGVNRFAGFAIGACVGLIYVVLALCLMQAAVHLIGNEAMLQFGEHVLAESYSYQIFGQFVPFASS